MNKGENEDVTVTPEVANEPVPVPEVPVPETPIPEAPVVDDLNDIDAILESLLKEEIPNEPVFAPVVEKETEEFVDESLLDDLDNSFKELEQELEEKNNTLLEKETALIEKDKVLLEETNKALAYAEALDKLGEHPILGPLNEKILKGEVVDIPGYLQKSLQEDLDALPNMDENIHESTGITPPLSLQEILEKKAKQRY